MGEQLSSEEDFVLVVGFPAGAFQANCYLLAAAAGRECVVVDPGDGAEGPVGDALREHRLTPAAVLATHGHLDHVRSAAAVADEHGVGVWIRPEDRALLTDPLAALPAEWAAAFGGPARQAEPAEVVELAEGTVELAGLTVTVDHVPGHTPGSVLFRLDTAEGGRLALTGDTLFAGSVGRTDLPGGGAAELSRSLREKVHPLDDETVVLPGHGPATTIGEQRRTNPFFAGREESVAKGSGGTWATTERATGRRPRDRGGRAPASDR